MTERPAHLPDYKEPPLDEVVVGVQFAPLREFNSLLSRDVWELFKNEFPKIAEQPPLEPRFETFGGVSAQPNFQLKLGAPSTAGRFWFISDSENNLLQFQSDRLILNWRNRPHPGAYPRFEALCDNFREYFGTLNAFVRGELKSEINVNQAEVVYINIIPVEVLSEVSNWFDFWNSNDIDIENLSLNFTQIIRNEVGKPVARMFHEIQSVTMVEENKKALRLTLTVRGKPETTSEDEIITFLRLGRERIVTRFEELTSNYAQKHWGKI